MKAGKKASLERLVEAIKVMQASLDQSSSVQLEGSLDAVLRYAVGHLNGG